MTMGKMKRIMFNEGRVSLIQAMTNLLRGGTGLIKIVPETSLLQVQLSIFFFWQSAKSEQVGGRFGESFTKRLALLFLSLCIYAVFFFFLFTLR